MRTVGSTLQNYINKVGVSKAALSAEVRNTRVVFSGATAWSDYEIGAGFAYDPQSYHWCSTDGKFIGVINANGTLYGYKSGSTSYTTLPTAGTVDSHTKPGIWCSTVSSTYYVYYVCTDNTFYCDTYNSSWTRTDRTSLGSLSYTKAACHAISSTRCAVIGNNDGKLALEKMVYSAGWSKSSSGIMMFPWIYPYPDDLLACTGAVRAALNGSVVRWYFYASSGDANDGSVYGRHYNETTGQWSDQYAAIQASGGKVFMNNVVVSGLEPGLIASIWLDWKEYPLDQDTYVRLFSMSTDGRTFNMGLETLMTSETLMPIADLGTKGWQLYDDGTYSYLARHNRIWRANSYKSLLLNITNNQIVSFEDTSSMGSSSAALVLADANESLLGNSLIAVNNECKIIAGYEDATITYGIYIIEGVQTEYSDGIRTLSVSLVNKSFSKTDRFIHPYYIETLGREVVALDFLEEGGLFVPAELGIGQNWFAIDMWGSEPYSGDGCTGVNILKNDGVTPVETATNHTLGVQSALLTTALDLKGFAEPIFDVPNNVMLDVDVYIYATSMTITADAENDRFTPILIMEDSSGDEYTIVATNLISTHGHPYRTYTGTETGDYPIQWRIAGSEFTKGDRLKRVAVKITSANATKFTIETIKVSNIAVQYSDGYGNTAWEYTTDVDNVNVYRLEGRYSRPYIMLAEAVSPKEFTAWSKFRVTNKAAGVSVGFVCFLHDGKNHTVCRYTFQNSTEVRAEMYLIRQGWYWTLGTGSNFTWADLSRIKLTHKNGILTLSHMAPSDTTWTDDLSITSMSSTTREQILDPTISHIGIYGAIGTAMVKVASIASSEGQTLPAGIVALPCWEGKMSGFSSTGTIVIESSEYTYQGKSSSLARGPFQGIKSKDYGSETGIDITFFWYTAGGSDYHDWILGSDTGKAWIIDRSEWQIVEDTILQYASRHFCVDASGNYMGNGNRVYIGNGFWGLSNVVNPASTQNGAFAFQKSTTIIDCHELYVATGEPDITIKGMLDIACKASGSVASFNDYYNGSGITVNDGSSYTLNDPSLGDYIYGYDISMKLPSIPSNQWIGVSNGSIIIAVRNYSGTSYFCMMNASDLEVYERVPLGTTVANQIVRITCNKGAYSVYDSERYVHTFIRKKSTDSVILRVSSGYGSNPTIQEILLTELTSFRGSVFSELGNSAISVISNIIQERPILYSPDADGSIRFSYFSAKMPTYKPTPYTINEIVIRKHTIIKSIPDGFSHGLSNSARGVGVGVIPEFADKYGFRLKTVDLGSLWTQEISASVSSIGYSEMNNGEVHNIRCRPEYRVEVGDIINFSYTKTGTGTVYTSPDMLVLGVSLTINYSSMTPIISMDIQCRRWL